MPATLADLPSGHQATLHAVGGERAYRRRLLELGFVPGTTVRLVRRVELGDVLEVELRHSRVSLRISEARAIALKPNEKVLVAAEPAAREAVNADFPAGGAGQVETATETTEPAS